LNREVIQGKDDMAERWAEDHRRILDAVSAGDPEAAYNALKSHLESVGSYLTENKNEQGGK
jgi:DNA-binding FadR family transcriptional regulator